MNKNNFNKVMYGEVITPTSLIKQMVDLIPKNDTICDTIWLDPGCGSGSFANYLHNILKINNANIHVVELNNCYSDELKLKFVNANICDFLLYKPNILFDVIIGNPPYNFSGVKKTPSNNKLKKALDGKTIWYDFVWHSLSLLKTGGYMCMIVPAIWMRPNKNNMHDTLMRYKIHKIIPMTASETNKLFGGHAQTPCSIFLLEKIPTDFKIFIWDKSTEHFELYTFDSYEEALPMCNISLVMNLKKQILIKGCLKNVIKTNMPSNKISFIDAENDTHKYKNIHTCLLENNIPVIKYKFSNIPTMYYTPGIPKLVLAHGVWGHGVIDTTGELGVSNRDKYIFVHADIHYLIKLKTFLNSDIAFKVFQSTQYRMRFLDKHAFKMLPDS
jgi:type I restriction-modification system DNA methylase subunit